MTTARQNLSDLAHQLKSYLLQEHKVEEWITTDRETFFYFRHLPIQKSHKGKTGGASPVPRQTYTTPKPQPQKAEAPTPPPPQPTPKAVAKNGETTEKIKKAPPSEGLGDKWLELQPLGDPPTTHYEEVARYLEPIADEVHLLREIPDDTDARKKARHWQHRADHIEALVISFSESGRRKTFLHNVAKAVDLFICPCRLVEAERLDQEGGWEKIEAMPKLQWLIGSETAVKDRSHLAKKLDLHAGGHAKLGSKNILLLPQLGYYLNNPPLKAALWETLVKALKK